MSAKINFSIRGFDPQADLSRIYHVRAQVEEFDHDRVNVTMDAIRSQLSLPGHNPARDRFIASLTENPNRVIGYSAIWPDGEEANIQIVVHPDFRRQGVATSLLERVQDRANQLSVSVLRAYAAGSNLPANSFLLARGFLRQGAYTELRTIADPTVLLSIPPSGFAIRPYSEIQNLGVLTHAMVECYQDLWGHNYVDEPQMAEFLKEFDPKGLFLLLAPEGRAVGISRVEISKDRTEINGKLTGYIDAPGIIPAYREQGMYHPLLLHGVHWLLDQNVELIEMESWGDDLSRLLSFEKYGFKTIRSQISYQKRIA